MGTSSDILLNVVNNTSITQSPILFGGNNDVATSTNTQQYTWDVTSFTFLGEQAVSIQYKLIGAASFTTTTVALTTLTFQGVCDALNTLGIGVFSTYTSGGSTFITAYTLTYVYSSLDLYNSTNVLVLTYNGTAFPVSNPTLVSDWNTYFNTSANALVPFHSVSVVGAVVTLYGGVGFALNSITTGLLYSDVLSITDNFTVTSVAFGGCQGSPITSVSLPNCTLINSQAFDSCANLTSLSLPLVTTAGLAAFSGCVSLTTISLPLLASIGNNGMSGNVALTTIYLPVCTSLGSTTGDNGVFDFIAGNIITLTIRLATSTDGDVVYLQTNNTVTLITT